MQSENNFELSQYLRDFFIHLIHNSYIYLNPFCIPVTAVMLLRYRLNRCHCHQQFFSGNEEVAVGYLHKMKKKKNNCCSFPFIKRHLIIRIYFK